jgi:hypothetical protein
MTDATITAPPDTLNARIGVLTRREVEARLLAPLVEALSAEFGRERVVAVLRDAIIDIAKQQGAQLAQGMGGDSLIEFADSLRFWTQGQRAGDRRAGPGRRALRLQRHPLPLRRALPQPGHPGAGRSALLQP